MAKVTTNIVVEFGAGTDTDLNFSAQVDERSDGLNSGKTSFSPGDSVGILLFKDTSIVRVDTEATAGNLSRIGAGIYQTSRQIIVFDGEDDEQQVSLPIDANFTSKWIGVNRGSIQILSPTKIRKSMPGIGVLLVNYESFYWSYRLSSPSSVSDEVEFTIACLFVGSQEL